MPFQEPPQHTTTGPLGYWREIGAAIIVWTALAGFALKAIFDRLFVRAYERNKREVTAIHSEWYADQAREFRHTAQLTEAHHDSLTVLEAGQLAQGEALKGSIDDHMKAITQTLAKTTDTLSLIQIEAGKTSTALSFISKEIETLKQVAWDGAERRQHDRRERVD